ncbi:MAG TPA: hypothetical protein VFI71_14110, partial [Pyrinomonadaceae bacterium]|nr:hypothetical protein [Pyrinomonadaceae bacterium]
MPNYSLSPYVSFIESHLIPGFVQRAIFHRLTGEIIEPGEKDYDLLFSIRSGRLIAVNEDDTQHPLIQGQFLIPDGSDPLA